MKRSVQFFCDIRGETDLQSTYGEMECSTWNNRKGFGENVPRGTILVKRRVK